MPDDRIRDFARNWAPEMRRTPNGYMKAHAENLETVQQALPLRLISRRPRYKTLPCGLHSAQVLSRPQGVSLQQRVDPFSGAATGTAAASRTSAIEDASP